METTIGGDRLGSGNKQQVSYKNYERSTHDLSYLWRSTMAAGTLVPFMSKLALPGDSWDIELNTEVLTLPTVGPLFGSYKVQLDVFEVPMRLYNAKLHMNKLGIGMNMNNILLPQVEVWANNYPGVLRQYLDNDQVNPSSLLKYLGISGIGRISGNTNPAVRKFSAIPLLAYWDIYKNYYSNKQEEIGMYIHTPGIANVQTAQPIAATVLVDGVQENIFDVAHTRLMVEGQVVTIRFDYATGTPNALTEGTIYIDDEFLPLTSFLENYIWDASALTYTGTVKAEAAGLNCYVANIPWLVNTDYKPFGIYPFPLKNIDDMREDILQFTGSNAFTIDETTPAPYGTHLEYQGDGAARTYSILWSQEGLGLKTYQSDLFNNWINTEWIEGENGVSELSKVVMQADPGNPDFFTIDALNIAQKVYNMLNRIAISGGTYDDWLDAVYTHERVKAIESPVYMGSLIKELAFQEVISNTQTNEQPLGTLAGRGVLTNKHKGGKIVIKVNEPSYIIGIVSITPRIEYSQGNEWDVNLKSFDDLHKPALDAIGFQDLVTDQLLWSDTLLDSTTGAITTKSLGKQPAWVNYMSSVNKCYGDFAAASMFMTLNRQYSKKANGELADPTTYIDPTKFNNIFAETSLDSQNFWVQIAINTTSRRKMSAKLIPNL